VQYGDARPDSLAIFEMASARVIERTDCLYNALSRVLEQCHGAFASVSAYADDCT
jgi:hypothetical protein